MEKRVFDPLQIVIIILLTLNLALTGALWLSRSNQPVISSEARETLPSFASREELSRMANEVTTLYNDNDLDALYGLFDPVAQAQITRSEFEQQLGNLSGVLGSVESVTYSHFEKSKYGQDDIYILHYIARLSNGQMDKGTVKLTAIDRGDHFGLLGFNLFAGTGP
jgi:hypothetical protein